MKTENIKIEDVRSSDCGCGNCLWFCIECKDYEKFEPKWSEIFKQPSCKSYTYYD